MPGFFPVWSRPAAGPSPAPWTCTTFSAGALSPEKRVPVADAAASDSRCWPNALTPWPCSITWPPWSPTPTLRTSRQGPYDMLITLSEGRSVGIPRQGADPALAQPALPPENRGEPALAPAPHGDTGDRLLRPGQPPGRAHPGPPDGAPDHVRGHRGGALTGDHSSVVWQQCGNGMGAQVKIAQSVSLDDIIAWTDRLLNATKRTAAGTALRSRASPYPTRTPCSPATCGPR